jgi:hypothetical protein
MVTIQSGIRTSDCPITSQTGESTALPQPYDVGKEKTFHVPFERRKICDHSEVRVEEMKVSLMQILFRQTRHNDAKVSFKNSFSDSCKKLL